MDFVIAALSGKFEEMQYNEVGDFEEAPDVGELEALKRSAATAHGYPIVFCVALYIVL